MPPRAEPVDALVPGADALTIIVDDEEGDRALAAAIERAANRDG